MRQWNVFVFPEDKTVQMNIEFTAEIMDLIRNFLGEQIYITSWYRPEKYNELIKGAKNSQHIEGNAVDFVVNGLTPQKVRSLLEPKLAEWDIRMEDLPDSTWVHIDTKLIKANEKRFFIP